VTLVRHKSPIEIVTEVDLQAEHLIARQLKLAFPGYAFLGEEGSQSWASDREAARWIVDPIDGTTNFSRGYPLYAVSIALERQGQVVLGVVYNPVLDECFAAELGTSATLNGEPLQVSATSVLAQAVVASGFPYDAWSNPVDNLAAWGRVLKRVHSPRCDGSAALDLCHVAAGRLDAYWEIDLEPWDMAAGALIVQEAGGLVTAVSGEAFGPFQRSVLASNACCTPERSPSWLRDMAPGSSPILKFPSPLSPKSRTPARPAPPAACRPPGIHAAGARAAAAASRAARWPGAPSTNPPASAPAGPPACGRERPHPDSWLAQPFPNPG
jgi:myo-inositol-1(or 4)-monophosphatase